jgi:hypothetical protein
MEKKEMKTPSALMLLVALFGPTQLPAQSPARATISVSCAPWDGPAFELSIPSDTTTSASIITVAIWQAADIQRPATFRFPDSTQQVGAAWLITHAGKPEELIGSVTVISVLVGQPVVGSIAFTRAGGLRIDHAFRAEWRARRAICGIVRQRASPKMRTAFARLG